MDSISRDSIESHADWDVGEGVADVRRGGPQAGEVAGVRRPVVAAAAKALELAARGEVEVSPTISWIDPDVCAGCQQCIELCAYTAIEFDERRGVSVINEALCKGCGSCSGFCPSGAAQVKHFNEKQIFAELDGIVDALAEVGI